MSEQRTKSFNWGFLFREMWKGEEQRSFEFQRWTDNRQAAQSEFERVCNLTIPVDVIFGQFLAMNVGLHGAYLPEPEWVKDGKAVYHIVRPNYDTKKIPVPQSLTGSWGEAIRAFESEWCPPPSTMFLLCEFDRYTDEPLERPQQKQIPQPRYSKDQERWMRERAQREHFQAAMETAQKGF